MPGRRATAGGTAVSDTEESEGSRSESEESSDHNSSEEDFRALHPTSMLGTARAEGPAVAAASARVRWVTADKPGDTAAESPAQAGEDDEEDDGEEEGDYAAIPPQPLARMSSAVAQRLIAESPTTARAAQAGAGALGRPGSGGGNMERRVAAAGGQEGGQGIPQPRTSAANAQAAERSGGASALPQAPVGIRAVGSRAAPAYEPPNPRPLPMAPPLHRQRQPPDPDVFLARPAGAPLLPTGPVSSSTGSSAFRGGDQNAAGAGIRARHQPVPAGRGGAGPGSAGRDGVRMPPPSAKLQARPSAGGAGGGGRSAAGPAPTGLGADADDGAEWWTHQDRMSGLKLRPLPPVPPPPPS